MASPSDYIAALIGYSLPMAIIGYIAPVFFRRNMSHSVIAGICGGIALPLLGFLLKGTVRVDAMICTGVLGAAAGVVWSFPWRRWPDKNANLGSKRTPVDIKQIPSGLIYQWFESLPPDEQTEFFHKTKDVHRTLWYWLQSKRPSQDELSKTIVYRTQLDEGDSGKHEYTIHIDYDLSPHEAVLAKFPITASVYMKNLLSFDKLVRDPNNDDMVSRVALEITINLAIGANQYLSSRIDSDELNGTAGKAERFKARKTNTNFGVPIAEDAESRFDGLPKNKKTVPHIAAPYAPRVSSDKSRANRKSSTSSVNLTVIIVALVAISAIAVGASILQSLPSQKAKVQPSVDGTTQPVAVFSEKSVPIQSSLAVDEVPFSDTSPNKIVRFISAGATGEPDKNYDYSSTDDLGELIQQEKLGEITVSLREMCFHSINSCLLINNLMTERMQYICGGKFTATIEKSTGNLNVMAMDQCNHAQMMYYFYFDRTKGSVFVAEINTRMTDHKVHKGNDGSIYVLINSWQGGFKPLYRLREGRVDEFLVDQVAGPDDLWTCQHAFEVLQICAERKSDVTPNAADCLGEDIERSFPLVTGRSYTIYDNAYFFNKARYFEVCSASCKSERVTLAFDQFSPAICNPMKEWSAAADAN